MKTETPMKLAASSEFLSSDTYSLWYIQQRKLSLPSFEQHGVAFPLIVTESDILAVDVPVARLQLSNQPAFGVFLVAQEFRGTDIESQRAKQNAVRPKTAEHLTELPQVFPQECVRLPLRHGACRIAFARQDFVPPTNIRVVFFRVPAFKISGTPKCPFHKWQPVDSRLPVRSFMASVPCGHGTDRQKRTEDSHEYTHHRVRGLKFPMGTTVITPSSFTFRLLKSNSNS